MYDSGNEPSNEDELRAYQSRFGNPRGTQEEAGQSSTIAIPEGGPGQSFHYPRGPGAGPHYSI